MCLLTCNQVIKRQNVMWKAKALTGVRKHSKNLSIFWLSFLPYRSASGLTGERKQITAKSRNYNAFKSDTKTTTTVDFLILFIHSIVDNGFPFKNSLNYGLCTNVCFHRFDTESKIVKIRFIVWVVFTWNY